MKWVEEVVGVGFLVAVEPGEFTTCVEDHGNVLWGCANG